MCAAASDVTVGTALTYLPAYNPPPLLRLLIHDRVDYGRRCNFLHAIAASLSVWAQFPWVLTLDGPNNLPVPRDFALIAAYLRHVEPKQHPPMSLLGDNTSTAKEARWGTDKFLFWPSRLQQSAWRNATGWCLQRTHAVAGALLEEMRVQFALTYRVLPKAKGSRWRTKLTRYHSGIEWADAANAGVFGAYGYHTPRYVQFLERRNTNSTLLVPRAEDTTGWEEAFPSLTASIDMKGHVRIGDDAQRAFDAHTHSGGLWMMATTRQARPEFEAAAAMHRHWSGALKVNGLLLICNNASVRGNTQRWLRLFDDPSPPLRMLIRSSINMGYHCGELHALHASKAIWSRYAWVLYTSGPDVMPTPHGGMHLAESILRVQSSITKPAFLGDRFPAPPNRTRWSMDLFVFWPSRFGQAPWRNATSWCLHGFGPRTSKPQLNEPSTGRARDDYPIPEMLLEEVRLRFGLRFLAIGQQRSKRQWREWYTRAEKHKAIDANPPQGSLLWHSHNSTAVINWASGGRVTCSSSGVASLSMGAARLARLRSIKLMLPDGSVEELKASTRSFRGRSSTRFSNERHVLKLAPDAHMVRREACTLRLLQGTGVVPKLRCANGHVLVTERVGTPLSEVNLPSDYREQLLRILQMMSAHGVSHNDLWKEHDLELPSLFSTELTVDGGGKLHVIDFNTATVNGSYACEVGVRPTALPPHLSKYFIPSSDEGAMQVLDAMATVNRKLHSYTESIGSGWNVRVGICRLSTGWSLPSRLSCADVTGGEGLFVSTSEPEEPQWTTTMKPETTEASMPTLADLKACMRRCEACPRCAAVSVSSRRRMCMWFAAKQPSSDEPCELVEAPSTMLRTARMLRRRVDRLDDFVTVVVSKPVSG